MQLCKIAIDSGDRSFVEGVEIIENACQPLPSKHFITVEVKGEHNEWKHIPLGMTEA